MSEGLIKKCPQCQEVLRFMAEKRPNGERYWQCPNCGAKTPERPAKITYPDGTTEEVDQLIEELEPYKQRMYDEFHELESRASKLYRMLMDHKAGTLGFKPTCPIEMLWAQYHAMQAYAFILIQRAEIEGIDLQFGSSC